MNRLTYFASGVYRETPREMDTNAVVTKLGKYEDTGVEPEDIPKLKLEVNIVDSVTTRVENDTIKILRKALDVAQDILTERFGKKDYWKEYCLTKAKEELKLVGFII